MSFNTQKWTQTLQKTSESNWLTKALAVQKSTNPQYSMSLKISAIWVFCLWVWRIFFRASLKMFFLLKLLDPSHTLPKNTKKCASIWQWKFNAANKYSQYNKHNSRSYLNFWKYNCTCECEILIQQQVVLINCQFQSILLNIMINCMEIFKINNVQIPHLNCIIYSWYINILNLSLFKIKKMFFLIYYLNHNIIFYFIITLHYYIITKVTNCKWVTNCNWIKMLSKKMFTSHFTDENY